MPGSRVLQNPEENLRICNGHCENVNYTPKKMTQTDGGWAWMIVLAVIIINVTVLPIQQSFGLVFEERFSELGITATQISLIFSLNSAMTCAMGLLNGPMLKKFVFRTVAYLGSICIVLGICALAFADSLPSIIFTYCILIGIGLGIIYPATSLALNTYFRKKRSVAMGITVTLTGLGPILMPLLIDGLISKYSTRSTILILGGIAMHSFIGASLLKPFISNERNLKETENQTVKSSSCDEMKVLNNSSQRHPEEILKDLNNTSDIDQTEKCLIDKTKGTNTIRSRKQESDNSASRNCFSKIANTLDLDLLRDRHYLFIVVGMSVSLVSETNFNLMIPFILSDMSSLKRTEIARIMSVQAAADILARFCIPLLIQRIGWKPRSLYIISLIGFTIGRTLLNFDNHSYNFIMLSLSLIVGVAKGTKAVFQALVIPDFIPLERLPAASGILSVCNGIAAVSLGPLIDMHVTELVRTSKIMRNYDGRKFVQ
ncbi:monocarboxylate transporter 14 isoform X2 [Orussus abietinus]|uniref:monocarboxylate transporter 14 isoform X2 n=1 Tax=Orussus abietinus TaxID=222816 RepID=UPI000C7160EC|nr:monocarboxylate transporter 14 isoform X2 [Orussus abietinus]